MKRLTLTVVLALGGLVASIGIAWAQIPQSRCADCHFANPAAPGIDHARDVEYSAHGRAGIGCEQCHGGNSSSFEPALAHRNLLPPSDPASPVNPRNLPLTCGHCHAGPLMAFEPSRHYQLLDQGDARAPTCATCHGAAGRPGPSPKALEKECAQCHGPKGIAVRPGRAAQARVIYQSIADARDLLGATHKLIGRITDPTRRAQMEKAYREAELPLTDAIYAGHQFVYDGVEERLASAQQRITELMAKLMAGK